MSNFHPLEVVDRCSETQLQVDENLYCLIESFRDLNFAFSIQFKVEFATALNIQIKFKWRES